MNILVLNGGSSSIKAALFRMDGDTAVSAAARPLWKSTVEFQHHEGTAQSVQALLDPLIRDRADIHAVGHRIVHGGKKYRESASITAEVKAAIVQLASFAPEHNLLEAEAIETAERLLPRIPQVAVFDTAFHATLPAAAYTYPGPYEWLARGIRRYGFHGISHQYCSRRAAELLERDPETLRMVTCHLGSGCSLAAVKGGRSVDTTMGFTPLEGLMMGTRSGSIDPGILIHLVRHLGSTAADLDRILNKESGLQGIGGNSGDMRDILSAMDAGDARARLAFDIYIHRLAAGICSMLPSLGGLDALVFTAGVGENAAAVRAEACRRLAFLGVRADDTRNTAQGTADFETSAPESKVRVLVVHTQEEWEIARECAKLVGAAGNQYQPLPHGRGSDQSHER